MVNLSEEIKNKIKVLRKDFKLNPLEIKYHPIMKNDDKLFNLDVSEQFFSIFGKSDFLINSV